MGLAASQARLLSLTSRLSDLELRAQVISNAKIRLSQEGEQASKDYQRALDKKIMKVQRAEDGSYINATLNNTATYEGVDSSSTKSKWRYVTNTSGNLVMTESQAKSMGLTVQISSDGKYSMVNANNWGTIHGNIPTRTDGQTNSDGTNFDTHSQAYKYYTDIYGNYISKGKVTIIPDNQGDDPDWMERQIKNGSLYLNEYDENAQFTDSSPRTNGTDGLNSAGHMVSQGAYGSTSWTSGDTTLEEVPDSVELAISEAKYEAAMASINAKDKRFDRELKQIDTEHQATQTTIDSVKKVIDKNIERTLKMFQA